MGLSSLDATNARLIRMAFCEGRRLCLALILEREEECFEDRVPALPVDRVEPVGFFEPVFPEVDELDFVDVPEVASGD